MLTFLFILCAADHKADVVVYGATSGGALAAIATAREGKTVLLIDPGTHLGGMITSGLGATDTGNRAAIGGYSREFFVRVRDYYISRYGASSKQVKDCSDGYRFEPSVAMLTLKAMLAEAKVTPVFKKPLRSVKKSGTSLVQIVAADGDTYSAKIFIDATYEGDLLAAAGVKYHVGREGREVYGESLAGVQAFSRAHQFYVPVNGFDAKKNPLPLIYTGDPGKPGQGDKKVQAYNYRLCLTDRAENRVPFGKPEGYDPARFELLARYLKARPEVKFGQLCNPVRMPNDKTDTNNNGPISTDHIGANWEYPEGDQATRERILKDHILYTKSFFYFLASDPRVPPALQKEVNRWGYAKDEWADNDHFPPQIYVREARRMLGAYVMTQKDLMTERTKDDSVALGSYNADSHHAQRFIKADGTVINEGDFQVPVDPYAISYRCLTPKSDECANLLVCIAVSTSHVAYGSVRMEPVFLSLGQAAGVAAAHAIDEGVSVQKIDLAKLTAKLKKQKAVLSPLGLPGRPKSSVTRLDPKKLAGIVVDDTEALLTGEWKGSAALGPYVGEGYVHDDNADKGKLRARFPAKVKPGTYDVRLYFPPGSNRATNVLVIVSHEGGITEKRIDQRARWDDNHGVSLGVYRFAEGKGYVEIRNDDSNGHVIADAVLFAPAK
ncbi:MAG: FAD-dependent oxidoreductase [Gemmataceae bacterium]